MTTGIDGLTPCPFCGAGVTRIDEHRHWTGMRYQVLSVEVRHWCAPSGALPRAYISCTGKTTEEAVEKWNTRVHKAAKSEEKPCPDCAEMTKQRDHYREQSRANSSGQLAEELSCALARIERLELALEAWEETYSPCEHDPNYPSWCLTHHTKRCNVEEARRLTEEARK